MTIIILTNYILINILSFTILIIEIIKFIHKLCKITSKIPFTSLFHFLILFKRIIDVSQVVNKLLAILVL